MASLRADLALLVVTLIWGATFPLIRGAIAYVDPYHFVFLRFSIGTLLFALIAWRRLRFTRAEIAAAAALSFVLWLSYITQTIGMETIPSGRAAFITGMNVVLVPFLAPLFGLPAPRRLDYAAALGAGFGLYLLTDPVAGGISAGDGWVFGCALAYALYIILLQKFLERHPADSVKTSFMQVAGVWLCSVPCLALARSPLDLPRASAVWIALVFCATLATIGTAWLQTHFQKYTTASRTALIFAMEPVFAAMFGYLLLGETMGARGAAGAIVIIGSILASEWLKARTAS